LWYVTQSDGKKTKALAAEHSIEPDGINLDEMFQEFKQ